MTPGRYQAVVMGCSAGGLAAVRRLLRGLGSGFPLPILLVAHTAPDGDGLLAPILDRETPLQVQTAAEKEPVLGGRVYVAPPGYHLLVERDRTLALSVDPKVCHVRPSIDVLFESAGDAWGPALIGVILTGANDDGARGLAHIRGRGGLAIVQDPGEAEVATMPLAAIERAGADHCLPLAAIGPLLVQLAEIE